ncbi:unnamed protein product [Protopolystoma xenopodis]|uniref:Uncharacterized protein n=1 Tax=Protopolystoma xenopodis TaxID=117903 RepID=A0A3S5AGG2_9PLAT|nr:unnamed protein product [Protopolystoma xenopodis]
MRVRMRFVPALVAVCLQARLATGEGGTCNDPFRPVDTPLDARLPGPSSPSKCPTGRPRVESSGLSTNPRPPDGPDSVSSNRPHSAGQKVSLLLVSDSLALMAFQQTLFADAVAIN